MFRPINEDLDGLWLDWLSIIDDSPREVWATFDVPTKFYLCDKCEDKPYPAHYVNTETEEAWCKDCIESVYYYVEALEKNFDK